MRAAGGRVTVGIHVPTGAVAFTPSGGSQSATVVAAAAIFDASGAFVAGETDALVLHLPAKVLADLAASGIALTLEVPGPAGKYRLKTWVNDLASGHQATSGRDIEIAGALPPKVDPTHFHDFSGRLVYVGQHSLEIATGDERLVAAQIPDGFTPNAAAIAGGHQVGDSVKMRAMDIPETYDASRDAMDSLALTTLTFSAPATARDLAAGASSQGWREHGNLLARPPTPLSPPAAPPERMDTGPAARLAAARTAIRDYVATMPNYIADEKMVRSMYPVMVQYHSPNWGNLDTVESEVSYAVGGETRTNIQRNGQPWTQAFEALSGLTWRGGFQQALASLFLPGCPATFTYDSQEHVDGETLTVYKFQAPAGVCLGPTRDFYQGYYAAEKGRIAISDADHLARRLEEQRENFPNSFPQASNNDVITWKPVTVDGTTRVRPATAQLDIWMRTDYRYRVRNEYSNYRHFGVSTQIKVIHEPR